MAIITNDQMWGGMGGYVRKALTYHHCGPTTSKHDCGSNMLDPRSELFCIMGVMKENIEGEKKRNAADPSYFTGHACY